MKISLNRLYPLFFCLLFLMSSCGSNSLDDYREEATSITRALVMELSDVKSKEELLAKAPRLKKKFNELADVMIGAAEYAEKHSQQEETEVSTYTYKVNSRLREELERLYKINGAREIIERSQNDALNRLSTHEHRKETLKGKKYFQTVKN